MFGLQTSPVFETASPPCHRWPSARPMRRSVPGPTNRSDAWRLALRLLARASRLRVCARHLSTGSGPSERAVRKIASHSLATAAPVGVSGKIALAQDGVAKAIVVQLVATPARSSMIGLDALADASRARATF